MLNSDFKEFIGSLNSNEVRFLVIGGYAVAFHGHPRYTKDLDIWIDPKVENAVRVIRALEDFGLGTLGVSVPDLVEPQMIVQFGVPPNRIDIINSPDGIDFDECYGERIEIEIDGVIVPVISLEDLIRNKRASGRHQDLADIENLESGEI